MDNGYVMAVNEEGMMIDLPPNSVASQIVACPVVGNVAMMTLKVWKTLANGGEVTK